jgi:hypothetical protein
LATAEHPAQRTADGGQGDTQHQDRIHGCGGAKRRMLAIINANHSQQMVENVEICGLSAQSGVTLIAAA